MRIDSLLVALASNDALHTWGHSVCCLRAVYVEPPYTSRFRCSSEGLCLCDDGWMTGMRQGSLVTDCKKSLAQSVLRCCYPERLLVLCFHRLLLMERTVVGGGHRT